MRIRDWFWELWWIELIVRVVHWIAAFVESVGDEVRYQQAQRARESTTDSTRGQKRGRARGRRGGNGVS